MNAMIVEKELSFQIVNAAYEVHNHLGPGYLEAIYQQQALSYFEGNRHVTGNLNKFWRTQCKIYPRG